MKTVKLADGRLAHFPETIHPDVMKATIDKHNNPGMKPAIMVMHDHETSKERDARDTNQQTEHKIRHQQTLATMADHNKKSVEAIGEHTKATVAVANGVNKGLDAIMKGMVKNAAVMEGLGAKLDALSKSVQEVKGLSKCVDDLTKTIEKSCSDLAKVMKSPRKLVHSAKGRPIGMQISED